MTEEKLICACCGEEITPGFEYGTEEHPLCDDYVRALATEIVSKTTDEELEEL